MCVTLNSRTLRSLVSSPYGRVCARFEPVVSNSCSTSGSSGEDTRDLSWVFKVGEKVCGEPYWLIFMGAVGDGDFWLFDWRIAQEMCELKCVVRCRRNVMGWHLWPTFRVDILKSFSKEYLIWFVWILDARSRRVFMEVIFLWSVFRFAYLTLYICSLSLLFHSYFQIRSRGYALFQFSILWYITFCFLPLISNDLIFYFSRIFPILAFLLCDSICLLTCAKKPRFEPFFGFSRGFLSSFVI